MTKKNQIPFPTTYYHIKALCYLTEDGRWIPCKEGAKAVHSSELPSYFLDSCTLERVREDKDESV
mgnify:CR=1 FL=1